ncbi:MAG: DUF4340 domain-containing protein [Phycisphaerales bacterium]|nr:DUF4340 domain-containing protein [Phycisphaerales bacterium]
MGWRSTCIMCLLAAVAAVTAWQFRMDSASSVFTSDVNSKDAMLISRDQLPRDQVQSISIVDDAGEASTYEREGDEWWMVSPFRHQVRVTAMHQLIDAALLTEVVDSISVQEQGALERYQLQTPRAVIGFHAVTRSVEIELGRTGIGGRGYVRHRDGEHVLLTSGSLHEQLFGQNPVQWRERSLFPGMDIEIDRLSRSIDGKPIVIERAGRIWKMTDPISTRIDSEAMSNHVINLARAEWTDVLLEQPEDLAGFGLDPPVATLRIERGGETMELHVGEQLGSNTQDRAAMVVGVPVVLRISGDTVGRILSDPGTLIDHTGSGILPADVKRVVIELPEETIILERVLDEWSAPSHADQAVPAETVDQLLDALTTLRATEVELKTVYPEDLERARVTFHGFDAMPMDTVRLLRETGDAGRWGMENGDRVIRIHPEFLVLPLAPVDYGLPVSDPAETP